MSHQIEAINSKRSRWEKEANEAALALQQYEQMLTASRSNSVNNDPDMTMNGSIFNKVNNKVEGTNGAGAASTSSNSATNNNGGSETQYDSATQNTPTGPMTQQTGSGTVTTSSALTDAKSGNNDSQTGDYLKQQKDKVKKEFKDSENTFSDYMSFFAQYNLSQDVSVFGAGEGASDSLNDALGVNNSANNTSETGNTSEKPLNEEDKSDPKKTDIAYQDPDKNVDKETQEQQILKQMQDDALKQNSLFTQYKHYIGSEDEATANVA